MPVVGVLRDDLLRLLGWAVPESEEEAAVREKEFSDLCFEFGIELDAVTVEDDKVYYKIEIAANRYDLLCIEGISTALRVFLGLEAPPRLKAVAPSVTMMHDSEKCGKVRPFVVCALLRNIRLTPRTYQSCIELQEKLHFTACRRRSLVAIGTHDFDKVTPPFTYTTDCPQDIKFAPLNVDCELDGYGILEHFGAKDHPLRSFVRLLKDDTGNPLPELPIIYDSQHRVLSLPPLINGDLTKLTMNTKNMFIECTATDYHRSVIVLNVLVAMFARYCEPQTVEQVRIVETVPGGKSTVVPDVEGRMVEVKISDICQQLGVSLKPDDIVMYLRRMMLDSSLISDEQALAVRVPISRMDVLHPCDVIEDVAIAYGYNRFVPVEPPIHTHGTALRANKIIDQLRREVAISGYVEMLTSSLCSERDNAVRRDVPSPVRVMNPKTSDFAEVRNSLMASLLKTTAFNRTAPLPIRLFELSDVVHRDAASDTGARNVKVLGVIHCAKSSGLELIHGMLDRVMLLLGVRRARDDAEKDGPADAPAEKVGYFQVPKDRDAFLPGRCAEVLHIGNQAPVVIGVFGTIHPSVLAQFSIPLPCSYLELELERLL